MARMQRVRSVLAVSWVVAVAAVGTGCSLVPVVRTEPGAAVLTTSTAQAEAPSSALSVTTEPGSGVPPSEPASTTAPPATAPPTTALPTTTSPATDVVSTIPPEWESMIESCPQYYDDIALNANLQACAKGQSVVRLQQALIAWGVGDGLTLDGEFGPSTQRAVLLWQHRHGWPDPTTSLEKYRSLIGQILASLENPNLPRDVPCPVWNPVDEFAALQQGPHAYRPLFDFCDESGGVEDLQLAFVRLGYDTPVNGRFDLEFRDTLMRVSLAMQGRASDLLMWEDYWFYLGD